MAKNNQQVGNIGLYYVAFRLTQKGFNVFPTIRNAKGADIYVIDPNDNEKAIPIQVKTLSKKNPIPFGTGLDRDEKYLFLVVGVDDPKIYFTKIGTLLKNKKKNIVSHNKNGKKSHWISTKIWEKFETDLDLFLKD